MKYLTARNVVLVAIFGVLVLLVWSLIETRRKVKATPIDAFTGLGSVLGATTGINPLGSYT